MPQSAGEQHVPASSGRSRGSCYALVSPAVDELWLEQPPQHMAIYTTPGNPYPVPWPPRSPQTRREIRRVLELPTDHVPTDAWADAPGSAKAAAREALQPGKRKAPLKRDGKKAGGTSQAQTGRPPLQGSSTAPAAFDLPSFLRRPSPEDPTASPFFFKISAGSMQPSRLHESPLSGTRPASTYSNAYSNAYSDRSFLGSPALSTRPGSQITTRDFWSRPESRPPAAAMLRSAGCMKTGITAAVGSTGATASESAIAAAALAWDLAPPLQQGPADVRPPGRFLRPPSPSSPPPPPRRRLEEAAASLHTCLGRVARRVEPHKAETEQWARGGKAPPAAVERRRRHMALPLLSPQTLSDWELLLEPSRRQIMGQLQEVTHVLKMAPRSTNPSPAAMPVPRRAGIDSPDLEHSFALDAEALLQQPWQQSRDVHANAQDEFGGVRSQDSGLSLQQAGPVPAPSLAFQEEFRRLHQQLQQQHGTLPPLVSDQAKQQQQQQQQQWRRQQEQQLSAVVEADAEMEPWAEAEASGSTDAWHQQQPRLQQGFDPTARLPGSRSSSSCANSAVRGSREELSLSQLMPGDEEGEEQQQAAESGGEDGDEQPGQDTRRTREPQGNQQGTSPAQPPQRRGSEVQAAAEPGAELGPEAHFMPDLTPSGPEDAGGRWLADGGGDVTGRPSFLNHFSTDPVPHLWSGSPLPAWGADDQGGVGGGSARQGPSERFRCHGSDAAARAAQPGARGPPAEDGFRFSSGQGPPRVQSAEAASRSLAVPGGGKGQPERGSWSLASSSSASRLDLPPGQHSVPRADDSVADRAEAGGRSCSAAPGDIRYESSDEADELAGGAGGFAEVEAAAGSDTAASNADLPAFSKALQADGGASDAEGDATEQSPVKTSGIGYTVVKSVQVWQPDHDEQQEAARMQQLEQLQLELGDVDHSRAAKLRAGNRAAKALHKQLGEGELGGFGGSLPEGVSMLRLAPASRQLRASGPGTDRPVSASSRMESLPQQSSLPRTSLQSSTSLQPFIASSDSTSRHSTPRPAPAPPQSSHHIVSMTTKAGQAVDTQSIWTASGQDS